MNRIVISDKKHIPAAAAKILDFTSGRRLLAFHGAMGAGKTTIIKAVCRLLGAQDIVSSPTFTLINEYMTAGGESIYHIDFYRIRKPSEVFDFGIEEYFLSGSWCLMEWPELIGDILPEESAMIYITVGDDGQRIVDIL
ncbi:MAG: tRNA (adenosine(37)-N6)-threonylcarbamoyltransferase complex ATPase subunit type 1 TsaE [Bacteroidales bacterium]|jgi:tRNA threonylcarbamoyladenosine biosynthesis protein TsaE|nr:tRNA (adenosine(37)-N6)-threonylcarbamoyltransferase complex ATPase subunit type 1 TsaE [Bacteroidales bacterium]